MDLDLIRHHAEALKDVVDIQINDSQDVVTFGRVGRVIMFSEIPFSEYRGPLVYMLTLNGREPSPKEFCAKFWHNGHRKEITIANLTDGDGSPDKVQLTHILELWHQLEDLMETDDFDTEFQMSARNAIFA